MSLSAKLARDFDPQVRKRGQYYYWQGLVRIQHGSERSVEAVVRGSDLYDVSLDWEDGTLEAWCDCAYFDTDAACKHLWATILAAEAKGYLSAAASAPYVSLDWTGEGSVSSAAPVRTPPPPPDWRDQLNHILVPVSAAPGFSTWPPKREVIYVVDAPASSNSRAVVLSLRTRDRKQDGTWTRGTALKLKRSEAAHLPDHVDREIFSALAGAKEYYGWGTLDGYNPLPDSCILGHPLDANVLRAAAQAGRCYLRTSKETEEPLPLAWDDGEPWQFGIRVRRTPKSDWDVAGVLRRGEERMDVFEPVLITPGGLVFTRDRVAFLAGDTGYDLLLGFRRGPNVVVPDAAGHELVGHLLSAPGTPVVEAPEELRYEEVSPQPRPVLRIRNSESRHAQRLLAELSFDYDGRLVPALEKARGFYDPESRRFLRRDSTAEKAATDLLADLGVKFHPADYSWPQPGWDAAPTKLPKIVRALLQAGWHIEADGKIFRRPGAFHVEVSSGVDWFELHGNVEYGETTAKLPELLEAVRRGDSMVRLDDGTYGVLPEEWLRKYGMLAGMGTRDTDHIRFRPSQAGLLDALLAAQPEVQFDEGFARVRQQLQEFRGIETAEQPAGFTGQLRDYQRDGLGWMQFLRRFSFGGCLADDMGVGKTAQVLALFETRRQARESGETVGPSLVVVPRSLVFNWKQEAARFTPRLRVLDYTGVDRNGDDFNAYDFVITTYGTLRRDVPRMKEIEFDYVVLDEAQAVKNAATESSKAVRLLRGRNRLALSGTPIENHLGELWTLFEFLNPGMLGAASVFKLGAGRNPDEDTRQMLAHALRPFILRRTKEQVARELPPKTEQTVYCEMEPVQRKLYNELRQHYRNTLLKRVDDQGLQKSKIQVLEALLRLRQAACHPGLIDPKRSGEPSAKLETLIEQVREVLDEGHKALVFSQFTSLLSIVRKRLDTYGITYEYLDGATTDRQSRVERFQNDPDCRLFLISLKAGGLGLNLTAADYVFLLDPWWNPAVEAQAVDRAHRIGQTKQVFAYRLIAKETVEEKVLELQNSKRDLAAAIINQDNSVIRNLRREDLELLLS